MYYKSINIENFRGIKKLEINDLKQINLFSGRNNCGKTSILEALFLLSGMSNPQLPVTIHNFRDLILTEDEDFSFLFYGLDFDQNLIINSLSYNDEKRYLSIKPLFPQLVQNQRAKEEKQESKLSYGWVTSTNVSKRVEGLILEYKLGNTNKPYFRSEIKLVEEKTIIDGNYHEKLQCQYINPELSHRGLDKRLNNLIVEKKLENVLDVLKEIENPVIDIVLGAKGMIYVDIGLPKRIPLNIIGDGMRRILAVLAAISDTRNGVLLIDEIENGLHYSSLSILWKAIFKAAKDYNVQLFITTHSYECIKSFVECYSEVEKDKDDIRLYRIERKLDKHYAHVFSTDVLRVGIEKSFEVR